MPPSGQPATVAFTSTSAPITEDVASWCALRSGSHMETTLPNGKRATFYDLWSGHGLRRARFRRRLEADLGAVLDLLDTGVLRPVVAARYPLVEVAAALALAESRTVNGKIVLVP